MKIDESEVEQKKQLLRIVLKEPGTAVDEILALLAAAEAKGARELAERLLKAGPQDVEVEAPTYEPPTNSMTAADQAYNHANKKWRNLIDTELAALTQTKGDSE